MQPSRDKLAERLVNILQKLNAGEALDLNSLAQEFSVSKRTIQRDLLERFGFLALEKDHAGNYRLDAAQLGKFNLEDMRRFARFASVSDLFPKLDQQFFANVLLDSLGNSMDVKGFHYEDIRHKRSEFDTINRAILDNKTLAFFYQRVRQQAGDKSIEFCVEPYKLVNKNGIWYLVAVHDAKIKVFSLTRISLPAIQSQTFTPDTAIKTRIEKGDGIYFEGVMDEVVLKVSREVAVYFTRRAILPNQEIMQEMTDGTLIVMCRKVHEQEVLPLVRYWLPHIEIVAPDTMRAKLTQQLQAYLARPTLGLTDSKTMTQTGAD